MQPLLCSRHHRQVKQAVNLDVLNIINTDIETYKNIKNNQSMIKKLCASHQETKAIAE
jgi:hypothetical protein